MTRDEFVGELIEQAKPHWQKFWCELADEGRLRLSGIEAELLAVGRELQRRLWQLAGESLDSLACELEGGCRCGRRRERRKDSVSVDVLGERVDLPCTYLYCRRCKQGINPVRRWLGVESGGVSLGFERAMTDLTTRMTFGDSVVSMQEHHGQTVERTKAERITYQVGRAAQQYLQERRTKAREKLRRGEHGGVEQLVFTGDGGAVPVGKLSRPTQIRANTARTEVRKLAKGTRTITGREARFLAAHDSQSTEDRVVDCHIAPYEDTRFTGERMLAVAAEAGLADKSKVHGVFDMGKWIHSQFEEQFAAYEHSACADIMHVAEYLIDAGRVAAGQAEAQGWGMERKRRMLAGEYEKVLAELSEHKCNPECVKSESGKCLMRVAHTYLKNNGDYMRNYEDFMVRGLPVGSGEAESGIRHVIKRRMSVAGAWDEDNAKLLLGLLTIRASGWWDDFWRWRDQRDKSGWHERQAADFKVLFRNKRGRTDEQKQAA